MGHYLRHYSYIELLKDFNSPNPFRQTSCHTSQLGCQQLPSCRNSMCTVLTSQRRYSVTGESSYHYICSALMQGGQPVFLPLWQVPLTPIIINSKMLILLPIGKYASHQQHGNLSHLHLLLNAASPLSLRGSVTAVTAHGLTQDICHLLSYHVYLNRSPGIYFL